MSTFQATIYAILQGFTEILPLSPHAHRTLFGALFDWPAPGEIQLGVLTLGTALALLLYFRHEWASMISSFLQVLLFRRWPVSIDERMPFFILVSLILPVLSRTYLKEPLAEHLHWTPLLLALAFLTAGLALSFFEYLSRKNKSMMDWNWLDAALMGLFQSLMLFPGVGLSTAALLGGVFRNYNKEAAAKYSFYVMTPILMASATLKLRHLDFHLTLPDQDLSWLTLGTTLIVSLLCSLIALGALFRHLQRNGFGRFVAYRVLLFLGTAAFYWWKT